VKVFSFFCAAFVAENEEELIAKSQGHEVAMSKLDGVSAP
jgi:hypothetical protein